jgi:hypothetical protein
MEGISMFAYIRDGVVRSLLNAESLEGKFTPQFIEECVVCGAEVEEGWTYDGTSFAAPVEIGPTLVEAKQAEIKNELDKLDMASIRPLRAHIAGTSTSDDTEKLAENEARVQTLRAELAALEGGE